MLASHSSSCFTSSLVSYLRSGEMEDMLTNMSHTARAKENTEEKNDYIFGSKRESWNWNFPLSLCKKERKVEDLWSLVSTREIQLVIISISIFSLFLRIPFFATGSILFPWIERGAQKQKMENAEKARQEVAGFLWNITCCQNHMFDFNEFKDAWVSPLWRLCVAENWKVFQRAQWASQQHIWCCTVSLIRAIHIFYLNISNFHFPPHRHLSADYSFSLIVQWTFTARSGRRCCLFIICSLEHIFNGIYFGLFILACVYFVLFSLSLLFLNIL